MSDRSIEKVEVDVTDADVDFFRENGYLELIDPIDTTTAVPMPLRAGGASFHHPRMLHFSRRNTTDRRRRAYANEFQSVPVPRSD